MRQKYSLLSFLASLHVIVSALSTLHCFNYRCVLYETTTIFYTLMMTWIS